MYVGRASTGSTVRGVEVAYNDIKVWRGPDESYGQSMFTIGIRMRSYSIGDSARVHHNNISVAADNNPATAYKGVGAIGIFMSGPGNGNQIYNNHVVALADTNGYYADRINYGMAYAIAIEKSPTDHGNVSYDNYIGSNTIPFKFGERNSGTASGGFGAGNNWVSTRDTIELIEPSFEDQWGASLPVGLGFSSAPAANNRMQDPVFIGSSLIDNTGSGTVEMLCQKTLDIQVVGSDNSPVPNATVSITNGLGQNVFTGTSNQDGLVDAVVDFHDYRSVSNSDQSQDYNPFTITASYASDSKQSTVHVTFDLGNQIIQLANTIGNGNEQDITPPAQINSLSVIPGDEIGHFTFHWMATGDDGTLGDASYDSIRYSLKPISESNWYRATPHPRSGNPRPSGMMETLVMSEPIPVPGQFYHVGIKAYDERLNESPLAVDSGFARGIITPQVVSHNSLDEIKAGQMIFYAPAVRSYLDIMYQFEMSTNHNMTSSDTAEYQGGGSTAAGTFTSPAVYDTVYVRCRALALDLSETSPWSMTRAFSVSGGFVNVGPATPPSISPIPGGLVTTTTPTLIVANSPDPDGDAVTYEFRIFDETGSNLLVQSEEIAEASPNTWWEVPSDILEDEGIYRWSARSSDGTAFSAWSEPISFTVVNLSTGLTPDSNAVFVYPNPISLSNGDQATFVLPDEPVDLTVMTVSGDVVYQCVGVTGNWIWDGTNQSGHRVAVGIYLWFVSGNTAQGKLVVKP
jgi:hypothetical protein